MHRPDALRPVLNGLFGALLLLVAGQVVGSPLDTCIGRLLAAGSEADAVVDLSTDCPGAAATLETLPLEPPIADRASLTQLLDARAALGSRARQPNHALALERTRLHAILAETWQPDEPNWWERFNEWLAGKLKRERLPSFLPQLADKIHLSRETATFIARGVLVVLLVLLVVALLNELQYRRGGGRRRPEGNAPEAPTAPEPPGWDSLATLAPVERIRELLRLVLEMLRARNLLARERALTNAECAERAGERLPPLGEPLHRLMARADRALYGGGPVTETDGEEARACAEAIRRQLEPGR